MNHPMTLAAGGQAAVLSYNLPEPTSYNGQRVVAIDLSPLGKNVLLPGRESYDPPPPERLTPAEVRRVMRASFNDPQLFPAVPSNLMRYVDDEDKIYAPGNDVQYFHGVLLNGYSAWDSFEKATDALLGLNPDKMLAELRAGRRLVVDFNFELGRYDCRFVPFQTVPRMVLLEKYRLSSLLGKYGAGRTLKTFSLLPGEKTKIWIKTYRHSTTQSRETSSILDSYTDESAQDFESALASEEADKKNQAESHEWHVEAEAENNWGVAKVEASAGYKGSTNSAREQFARNMSNAVQKHSAKASSKRDVSIQESTDMTVDAGEEQGIDRDLQNVNVGRTLNFVFRQMNQEFFTFLHLVDVQIGFASGLPGDVRAYTLTEMDDFIARNVVEAYRSKVKELVLDTLSLIFDYAQVPRVFWEERQVAPADGGTPATTYYRIKTEMVAKYKDVATDTEFTLPGIIVGVTKSVLRTDGVIAEAVLGQGAALDDYSAQLQQEAVRAKQLESDLQDLLCKRDAEAVKILEEASGDGAKVYALLYPPPPPPAAA